MSVTKVTDAMRNVTQVDASKITTGTIPDARIQASAVNAHVDLTAVRQDIAMLALYNAVSDNRVAYNLPFSFVDQFEDDTGITTQTDVDNVDEYFASVSGSAETSDTKLLLHMNDTSLTDSSSSAKTVTVNSGVGRSSAQSKFGGYSALFDGTSNGYLSIANHVDWDIGTGDFTIDFWVYLNSNSGGTPFSRGTGESTNMNPYIASGNLQWSNNGTTSSQLATAYSTGEWHHCAFVRSSGTLYHFKNGVGTSASNTTSLTYSSHELKIGGDYGWLSGYIDEFRFVKGVAKWTSNFTAPTAPYGLVESATGTLISDTQTASSATTKMSGVILYKDNAGTATLGTDLVISLSANGGTNYTEAASYGAVTPLFSTGVKMVRLGETTVTSGTAPVIKAVWANQAASSKETQLHGWAMNY